MLLSSFAACHSPKSCQIVLSLLIILLNVGGILSVGSFSLQGVLTLGLEKIARRKRRYLELGNDAKWRRHRNSPMKSIRLYSEAREFVKQSNIVLRLGIEKFVIRVRSVLSSR
jgi:hypothetical protein